jgi:purine nucleosidase/adenosylhomocysteine nucleosidase
MTHYLVIAATAVEAAHVPPSLPTLVTGVGKVAAAVRTTAALASADREGLLVINIGTAGALHPGLTGLHVPSRVLNHDISAEALAELGLAVDTDLALPDCDGSVLATGDTFVTDVAVRDRLARRAQLVDMEGFAVAYAAGQLGVAVRLVKHVSDEADASATDWPTVVDHSARALGDWLRSHL